MENKELRCFRAHSSVGLAQFSLIRSKVPSRVIAAAEEASAANFNQFLQRDKLRRHPSHEDRPAGIDQCTRQSKYTFLVAVAV